VKLPKKGGASQYGFNMRTLLFLVTSIAVGVSSAHGIIVAKSGGDYATITAGLTAANPGDTVFVKAGTYSEFVKWPKSGTSGGGYIVLMAFGDGPAKIDGTALTATQNDAELLIIDSKSHVAIIGMEICNFTTASGTVFLKGIQVQGASAHVQIKKCVVHHITTTNTTTNAGANAIGVFGTNGSASITDLLIDSCEVHDNKTGYSEAVSIDGNVDGFRVSHCSVHDNNNIGILIAGFYGESPNAATDQARHGVICDNQVVRCSSCDNPSYAGDCSADGIYSDGGGKSIFERNIISGCDIGIEAGAELATAVDDSMIVRDNLIYNCKTGGMFIGGYATGLGWTIHCRVENNTFYMNDANGSGSGEFLIQKSHDNIIRNNIFYTSSQKQAIGNAFNSTYCYSNTIDHNLFYSMAGGTGINGINLDAHAKTVDPLFVNTGTDFHCKTGSPAIDACDLNYLPAQGELDLDGNPRKIGRAVDIGAYESTTSSIQISPALHTIGVVKNTPRLVISLQSPGASHVFVYKGAKELFLPDGRRVLH
jgi:hypothetical protein